MSNTPQKAYDQSGIAMRQVSDQEPLMQDWKGFKQSPGFENCIKWNGLHSEGSLWAAFVAGHVAGYALKAKEIEDAK